MSTDGKAEDAAASDDDQLPVEVEAPVDPAVAYEAKIAQLEKDKKDGHDKFLRVAADLENLRKRGKREVDEAKLEAKQRVLKEILPVVDNLERAIEHASEGAAKDAPPNPIIDGVRLVLRQLTTAFERLDVTAIEAEGHAFDPNQHEAISQMESDKPANTVVQVLQRGYKSGDRLMRPALVVVAKPRSAPAAPGDGDAAVDAEPKA